MNDHTLRRLTVILAADVVGFSALMERDEEGTYTRIGQLRREVIEPSLAEFDGRLIKTIGDGFLSEFASPIAALKCAIAIQKILNGNPASVRLRIGINLGDVIVERDGDLYGEGVNIAARLEGLCDPGGILISEKIHREVKGKVNAVFEDRGEQHAKNISQPVHTFAVHEANAESSSLDLLIEKKQPTQIASKPSIAVLPFQNMSGDPEQEYFADGIVEDIITALSRFKSLFVIARNSSFTYKGKTVNVKDVGRELGVRYVLEGSVRKSGRRVRITGQLIEAASNNHLWADNFDGDLEDVFSLQDRVTASVVSVIAPKIQQFEIERAKRKPPGDLESYDFFLRGMAAVADRTAWATAESAIWFRKACAIDPNYADAVAMLAYSAMCKQAALGIPLSEAERNEAIRFAEQAYKLGSDDPFVLGRTAHTLAYIGSFYDRAEAMIEDAVRLNPNDANAWGARGWISLMCVQMSRAIESFEQRLRLSPLDTGRVSIWNGISFAHFLSGQYDQGRAAAAQAAELGADVHTLSALIMNDIGAGRGEEASDTARRLLKMHPDFRASYARRSFPARSPEWRDKMVATLIKAGIPE